MYIYNIYTHAYKCACAIYNIHIILFLPLCNTEKNSNLFRLFIFHSILVTHVNILCLLIYKSFMFKKRNSEKENAVKMDMTMELFKTNNLFCILNVYQ